MGSCPGKRIGDRRRARGERDQTAAEPTGILRSLNRRIASSGDENIGFSDLTFDGIAANQSGLMSSVVVIRAPRSAIPEFAL